MNQLHNRLGQSDWYMAWYQNNDVLKNSSSGGAFTAIAEVVLQNGGVVFGAYYDKETWQLYHKAVTKVDDLNSIRGSKYYQSQSYMAYDECRKHFYRGGCSMNIKKILSVLSRSGFFKFNKVEYEKKSAKDEVFNARFRNGGVTLSGKEKKSPEWRTVVTYRKYQVNKGNLWGYIYERKLNRMAEKTGIEFLGNSNIGDGLLIGHWGKIVINGNAKFGNEIMLTHGVTIGRDIRGKHKGYPTFGNRICIRTNSTVVGNISIGDDVLIAPNTFVNFDVPPHSIVIGNPAKIISRDNATEGHLPDMNLDPSQKLEMV